MQLQQFTIVKMSVTSDSHHHQHHNLLNALNRLAQAAPQVPTGHNSLPSEVGQGARPPSQAGARG